VGVSTMDLLRDADPAWVVLTLAMPPSSPLGSPRSERRSWVS